MGGHQESTEQEDEWILNLTNLLYYRKASEEMYNFYVSDL